MSSKPAITVVMPCYNNAPRISEAVNSVFQQTFEDLELIVVDDGSTDASVEVLRELGKKDSRLHTIQQANQGAGPARNTGLANAKGDYVAFLDSDDTWHPECLTTLHEQLSKHHDAAIAYCGWQNLGVPANQGRPFIPPDYENADKVETLLRGCRWPIHAALTRRALIEAVGGFDPQLTSSMDFDLWLRIGAFHRIVRMPKVLAYYHHHDGPQITKNRLRIVRNHIRIQRNFLDNHPEISAKLGRSKVRSIQAEELQRQAYRSFWNRDLEVSHALFRDMMAGGYYGVADLKYLLPAMLPYRIYAGLVNRLGR